MRIIGKVKKIKGNKILFVPIDIFPEEIKYFKKIKNKNLYLENEGKFEENKIYFLSEEKTKEVIYKNFKRKKNLYFSFKRGKYYIILENEFLKILINPENGGKIESFFDKKNKFEWFFDDASFFEGKLSRCGISQGFEERNLYEKKIDYNFNKKGFYGKRKEKDFLFEKEIYLNKKKIFISFNLNFKKEKEISPFFELKIFTGEKSYEYSIIYKENGEKKELPSLFYPFWGVWRYFQDMGVIEEIKIKKDEAKLKIVPQKKNLINVSFGYGLNYFYFRFFYDRIKRKNLKIKLLLTC